MVAVALPILADAGHGLWPGPHALARRLRSTLSVFGSATSALAVLDWPAGTVMTAFSGGNEPDFVLPLAPSVASSLGVNFSAPQSVAW